MQFHPVLVPLHLCGCGECEVCVLRFKGSVKSNHLFCICVLHPRFGFWGSTCWTITALSPQQQRVHHILVSFIRPRQDETSVITDLGHWKYQGHFSTCPFMGKMHLPADVSFMLIWSDFSLSGKRLRDGRNLLRPTPFVCYLHVSLV